MEVYTKPKNNDIEILSELERTLHDINALLDNPPEDFNEEDRGEIEDARSDIQVQRDNLAKQLGLF